MNGFIAGACIVILFSIGYGAGYHIGHTRGLTVGTIRGYEQAERAERWRKQQDALIRAHLIARGVAWN